ncbi:MAG: pyridoxine 5'-phosphate synthase [Bacteroidales bacterium]|nr:pyridoxine 5'-phosphate synthase [Bacteroidales bacterium]
MTRLSVNINKIACLRNARGGNNPDVIKAAIDCEAFGAQGITVHPRPDERHIRFDDVYKLKEVVKTEFNIEGNPNLKFIDLVLEIKPEQVTLVPDAPGVLTSNAGWDTIKNKDFLIDVISTFKEAGIRTSIFIETDLDQIEHAKLTGTDRIELYTEPYAANFFKDKAKAVLTFSKAAEKAKEVGLELNAGHDLDLDNLNYFKQQVTGLKEVSIGHALISDALYFGLHNTIQMYLKQLI